MFHDVSTEALFDELEKAGAVQDHLATEKRFQYFNLDRPTAESLYFLVLGFQRKNLLEIGTSHGYSTIWLAKALEKVSKSNTIITLEREEKKVEAAKENFLRAGVAEKIKVMHGDATSLIATLKGPFDSVFFDADRISAPGQFKLLLLKLEQNVLLLTDNALSHSEELKEYLEMFKTFPDWMTTVVPVGKGLHIAYRL
ncbi:MAG: methyltransferase domain-containing protein [Verrucomicrobia bacterium]|nr:methyltransferase domain-containing protein [Verrucomicrobiota bacterium]